MISYVGLDADRPHDLSDDFSGEEPYLVWTDGLDACAEPAFVAEEITIEDGSFSGRGGSIALPSVAPGRDAQLWALWAPTASPSTSTSVPCF